MELNSYQREVMGNLSAYLSALNETGNLDKAWLKYWNDQDVAVGLGSNSVPGYRNSIKGVPHVCMKVPTGGGKTFMACANRRTKIITDTLIYLSLNPGIIICSDMNTNIVPCECFIYTSSSS